MKKRYYGILLAAAVVAAGLSVTAQAADNVNVENITNMQDVVNETAAVNTTDDFVQVQSDEQEEQVVLDRAYTRSFSEMEQKYYFTFTPEETGYYYAELNFPENMNVFVLDTFSADALYLAEELKSTESYTFCLEQKYLSGAQTKGTGTITFHKAPNIKNVILQKENARDVFYNIGFEQISADGAKLVVEYENGTKTYNFDVNNDTIFDIIDDYGYQFKAVFLDGNVNITDITVEPDTPKTNGTYQARVLLRTLRVDKEGDYKRLIGTGYPIEIRNLELTSANKLNMEKTYASLKCTDGKYSYYWFTPNKSGAYYVNVTGYGADYWDSSGWFGVYEKTANGYKEKGRTTGTANCKMKKGKQYVLASYQSAKSDIFGVSFAKAKTYVDFTRAATEYLELSVKSYETVPLGKGSSYRVRTLRIPVLEKVVSYESDNPKVATVSRNGTIKGKKIGTAKITVTLTSGYSTSFNVKVRKKAVATKQITVDKENITLKKKKSYKIKAELQPITTSDKVKFTSNNKKVATVNAKGVVKAKKAGTAKITVKAGKKKVVVTVKVK